MMVFRFPVSGSLPENPNYPLFGAISNAVPTIHGRGGLQVSPIRGGNLHSRANIQIRGMSPDEAIQLAGQKLNVNGHTVYVCDPEAYDLSMKPGEFLASTLVVFRAGQEFKPTLESALRRMGVAPTTETVEVLRTRGIRMHQQYFTGNSVRLHGLSPEESELVLANGLGQFKTMGCGVFRPYADDRIGDLL